jgi:hypothetical protein
MLECIDFEMSALSQPENLLPAGLIVGGTVDAD